MQFWLQSQKALLTLWSHPQYCVSLNHHRLQQRLQQSQAANTLIYSLWPPYGIGQAIIFLPCNLFFFFFLSVFFLAQSQPSQIGCLPYCHTWCGLSANLECRSETCCTRLAENTWMQKIAICTPLHNLSGYIFATKAHINNRKKLVKQQYLLHMSPQYGKLRPTNGWDRFVSLGHPR